MGLQHVAAQARHAVAGGHSISVRVHLVWDWGTGAFRDVFGHRGAARSGLACACCVMSACKWGLLCCRRPKRKPKRWPRRSSRPLRCEMPWGCNRGSGRGSHRRRHLAAGANTHVVVWCQCKIVGRFLVFTRRSWVALQCQSAAARGLQLQHIGCHVPSTWRSMPVMVQV